MNLKQNWRPVAALLVVLTAIVWKFGFLFLFKAVFVVSAFLFLFSLILKSNTFALALIFTLGFTLGVVQLMGVPTIVPRTVMELSIIFLLAKALYLQGIVKGAPVKAFGFLPMLGLFTVSLLSFYINKQPVLPYILFLRHVFIFYLLFIALLNLNLSEKTIGKINRYLILLFLIQIPAALIKFLIIGQEEGRGIGTVSVYGGSLSTTLPLIAVSFLAAFYLYKRKYIYIFLIVCFIFFSLINQKRAFAFYLPVLLFFIYWIYSRSGLYGKVFAFAKSRSKIFVLVLLISFVGLYFAAKTQPYLNPEGVVGGSFSPVFMVKRAISYTLQNIEDKGVVYSYGRVVTTFYSFNLLKGHGVLNLLLGLGSGKLVTAGFIGGSVGEVYRSWGIIAGRTGLVWLVLQAGVLGILFFLVFHLKLLSRIYGIYKRNISTQWKIITLGMAGFSFIVILDFMTYSISTTINGTLTPLFYYLAAIVLTKGYRQKEEDITL